MLSTAETLNITFRPLIATEIERYISRYDVLSYAGAFEDDAVHLFAERIAGSYNIGTALPVSRLVLFLRELGVGVYLNQQRGWGALRLAALARRGNSESEQNVRLPFAHPSLRGSLLLPPLGHLPRRPGRACGFHRLLQFRKINIHQRVKLRQLVEKFSRRDVVSVDVRLRRLLQ